ncbi:Conserved oligomeric Golgi complex subunit 7, partial [Trinorchestia longiramus]
MDLAPFSAEDFDPKTWINGIFKGQEKNDKYASSLVMRLQLAIQEVNTSLEDTSQQLLSSLPRVVRDVESLGHEASLLKTQMDSLMADVQKVSSTEVSSSLDTLVKLETVKSRLASSSQALRQADNWTTLATEVEELLESGDLEAAAGKVVELQHCLSVLSQTPDSEDRADLLNNFHLRIEAMASPHVVEAFTQHNLSESIKYSGILRRVGRSTQALSYFHQCSLAALAALWLKAVENDSMTSLNLPCLVHYFDQLTTHLRKQ